MRRLPEGGIPAAVARLASDPDGPDSGELGPWATQSLVQELTRLTERKRRTRRIAQRLLLPLIITIGIVTIVWRKEADALFPVRILCELALAIMVLADSRTTHYHNNLARALGQHGNASAVGPLALTLDLNKVDTKLVLTALTELLPKIQVSDANLLDRPQRDALIASLSRKNPDYIIALLGALAQIADPAALPNVERLTTSDNPRIREAALNCKQTLEEASRLDRQKQTLLRASEPSSDLLRPVGVSTESDKSLLLRPGTDP